METRRGRRSRTMTRRSPFGNTFFLNAINEKFSTAMARERRMTTTGRRRTMITRRRRTMGTRRGGL